jgi:hypothetical protein
MRQDIMTQNPTCCGPAATVQAAAKLMMENDCGEIPVLTTTAYPLASLPTVILHVAALLRGKQMTHALATLCHRRL